MIPRILHITPTFNYTCGRSYYNFVTLKHLKSLGCYNYLFSKEGIAIERLKYLNIDYSINKDIGCNSPLSVFSLLKHVHNIVTKNEINIIHSYSRATEVLCLLYKYIYNKKIITVNTVLSLVDRRYFVEYKSDKLIAISLCVKSQLLNMFKIPENKIDLIYNYAEPFSTDCFKEHSRESKFRILSVGRYHKDKGFEVLLKSILYLKDHDIEVTIVGSGDLKDKYQEYIFKNNLNVTLMPPVNDLTNYFLNCDICVLPSFVDPLPTFMIQSGFYKKPFIGANVDGISETITDSYNGLLFEKGDSQLLAGKIMKFYQNIDLRNKCANNLYELVLNRHHPVNNVRKILELYKSCLK